MTRGAWCLRTTRRPTPAQTPKTAGTARPQTTNYTIEMIDPATMSARQGSFSIFAGNETEGAPSRNARRTARRGKAGGLGDRSKRALQDRTNATQAARTGSPGIVGKKPGKKPGKKLNLLNRKSATAGFGPHAKPPVRAPAGPAAAAVAHLLAEPAVEDAAEPAAEVVAPASEELAAEPAAEEAAAVKKEQMIRSKDVHAELPRGLHRRGLKHVHTELLGAAWLASRVARHPEEPDDDRRLCRMPAVFSTMVEGVRAEEAAPANAAGTDGADGGDAPAAADDTEASAAPTGGAEPAAEEVDAAPAADDGDAETTEAAPESEGNDAEAEPEPAAPVHAQNMAAGSEMADDPPHWSPPKTLPHITNRPLALSALQPGGSILRTTSKTMEVRVAVLGLSGAGKSMLVEQLAQRDGHRKFISTTPITPDEGRMELHAPSDALQLSIWDSNGWERTTWYDQLDAYDAVLYVVDCGDLGSLDGAQRPSVLHGRQVTR